MPAVPDRIPLLVAAGLVWRPDGRLLVGRRSETSPHGAGMLELPGGKLETAEGPRTALARELVEEWGSAASELRIDAALPPQFHAYPAPGPTVVLFVYHVDARLIDPGALRPHAGTAIEEHAVAELPIERFLAADRSLLRSLRVGRIRPAWSA
jgi:8-oxo-dGTP pyrophosphatase MutT (NUDIX family)